MVDKIRSKIPISADWVLKRIKEGKIVRLKNAIIEGDLDIEELDLPTKHVDRTKIQKQRGFKEDVGIIKSPINIINSEIKENTNFSNTAFSGDVWFEGAIFSGDAWFEGAIFSGDAWFEGATFSKNAWFDGTIFSRLAWFDGTKFEGDVLTFRDANFTHASSQEAACRKAKNVLEKNGDREEAGYHFYQEMEGKRKQKAWYFRYPEFIFIQLIFGYGVHPLRLMACWFLAATIFAISYYANGGILSKLPVSSLPKTYSYFIECFYFSIVTAVTPGYGKYELTSWVYQVIASIEAIFGTFMWAAFIATFARKYMK